MKKNVFLIVLVTLVIATSILVFFFKKEEKTDLTKVRLAEVTHSSFYTPLYVAIENGYFKDEGLDIELLLTPGADKVSAAVLSGDVELGFAGAESAIYIYKQKESDYLRLFAGLTKRDGQFIVARENDGFDLEDLYGKEILVGRQTGMPALNFLRALQNNGIDTTKININYSIEFAALSGSFIGGTGDFVNLFEPNATKMEQEGFGTVVASVGLLSDEVPYTAFYARKSYIDNNKDVITKFTKALNRGIEFTFKNDAKVVAKTIINQFPDTKVEDLSLMIERYRDYDCWLNNPYISEDIFNNLEDFLIDFKLIDSVVPYNDLVTNFYHE